MTQTGAAKSFLHADGQGSVGATIDAAGVLGWYGFYDAWGRTGASGHIAGAVPAQQYTGREIVGDDLYYYRARFYDARNMRFLQRDPIGLASGQINPYAYVGNDPVNFTDPSGLIAASSAKLFNPNTAEQQQSYVDLSGAGGETLAGQQSLASLVGASSSDGEDGYLFNALSQNAAMASIQVEVQSNDRFVVAANTACETSFPGGCGARGGGGGANFSGGNSGGLPWSGSGATQRSGGFGNITQSSALTPDAALGAGTKWLGSGYKEIAPGVYRSTDGLRQFRMTNSDIWDIGRTCAPGSSRSAFAGAHYALQKYPSRSCAAVAALAKI